MAKEIRQALDTDVSEKELQPVLSLSQMMNVFIRLYAARPQEEGKLTARVKKVQRSGIPIRSDAGKGRARYSLDQFFQILIVLELAELSISLATASEMVRVYWPNGPLSLAPAHAWFMHLDRDEDSLLILGRASELEGFVGYGDHKQAAAAQAGAFIVGAKTRARDGLSPVLLSQILYDRRLNLGRGQATQPVWRSSLIDCSTLIPIVVALFEEASIVTSEGFTKWARSRCDEFDLLAC